MSKLDELIKEYCPDGVEYKSIYEITIWDRKFNSSTKEMQSEIIKFKHITSQELKELETQNGYIKLLSTGNYEGFTTEELAKNIINENEVISIPTGGSANIKYFNGKFVDSGNILAISKNKSFYNLKYIYYFLKNINKQIDTLFRGSGVKHPDMISVINIKIPVPPIQVQEEIVRILDDFTELISELTVELIARKVQNEYLAQKLLDKKNFKNFSTIGEQCDIKKGSKALQKAKNGEYPLVATTEFLQSSDDYQFDCEAVCVPLISARGHGVASITRIFFQKGKFALGNILCAIIPKSENLKAKFLREYLYHYKDVLLVPLMRGGANVALTIDSLKNVIIPIPSIEVQNEVIEKINKMNELLDKKSGLPKEIEARQKQYEYYRNKLLTFKELKK